MDSGSVKYEPGSSVMPFGESSRISHNPLTQFYQQIESSTDISKRTDSLFDSFFPIIDELSRVSPPNSIVMLIITYFYTFQSFFVSFHPYLDGVWDFSEMPGRVIQYVSYICDFGIGSKEIFESGIPIYFVLIVSGLIFFWIVFLMIYFIINKTYLRNSFLISRILFSFVLPLCIIPLSCTIGFSFNAIFEDPQRKGVHITVCIFGLFFLIVAYIILYCDITFRASTPYLEDTILSMWDGESVIFFAISFSILVLCSRLIYGFPIWTRYFLIICHLFFMVFLFYHVIYFPYVKQWVNESYCLFVLISFTASFMQLLPIPPIYRIVIPFASNAIYLPLIMIFLRIYRRYIREKQDVSSPRKLIRTLRIMLADMPEEFVSWKLIKEYIKQPDLSTYALSRIAQMLSFFPSEGQRLNLFISILSKRKDLKYNERYLLFQIRRVHVLRQSSTSKQLNEDLENITKMSNQTISLFSQFLLIASDDKNYLSVDNLNRVAKINRVTDSHFKDALEKYPNNSKLYFEYSRYLIECFADYKEGIRYYQKALMIENGKRLSIDYSFRAMVNLFPIYLYNRIVDFRGRIVLNRRRGDRSGSTLSNMSNRMTTADFEENEDIESKLLDKPRLRYIVQRALAKYHFKGFNSMLFSTIFRFVFSILLLIIMLIIKNTFFTNRKENFEKINQVGRIRYYYVSSVIQMAYYWADNLNMIASQQVVRETLNVNELCPSFINLTYHPEQLFSETLLSIINSSQNFGRLIASGSEKNEETGMIVNSNTRYLSDGCINFCTNQGDILPTNGSLRYFSIYLLTRINNIFEFNDKNLSSLLWVNTSEICEITSNIYTILESLSDQSDSLINEERRESQTVSMNTLIEYAVVLPLIFLIYIILVIVANCKMNNEIKFMFNVINLMPTEVYKEACKPIFPIDDSNLTKDNTSSIIYSDNKKRLQIVSALFAILSILVVIITLFLFIDYVDESNYQILNLNHWLVMSSLRIPLVLEALAAAYFCGIYGNLGDTNYITFQYLFDKLILKMNALLFDHDMMIWGSNTTISCNNFDARLDEIHFGENCQTASTIPFLHEGYKCLSTDQLIHVWSKFANDFSIMLNDEYKNRNSTSDENGFQKIFFTPTFINFQHLTLAHLLQSLDTAQTIINDGMDTQLRDFNNNVVFDISIGFLLVFIISLIELFILYQINGSVKILKTLIARLPPYSIAKNDVLIELITGQTDGGPKKNGQYTSNVYNSHNPIMVLFPNCTIKCLNLTMTKLFGYTIGQVHHRPVDFLMDKDDYIKLKDTISEILKGPIENDYLATSLPTPFQFTGIKDDGSLLNIFARIFYIPYDNVIVLLMSDNTHILSMKNEIKSEQVKIEYLLHQIMPSQILDSVYSKSKVSFSARIATVLCVKISNLDEFIPSLSVNQLINSLSIIFKSLDSTCDNYSMLNKLNIINSSYYIIAGLFHQDLDPKESALQSISFAFECINSIEELNNSIESNMILTIGIHTSGPIIAGIMGNDSLVFDIVGEAFNGATILSGFDEINSIIISEDTYRLIENEPNMVFEKNIPFRASCGKNKATFSLKLIEENVPNP